METRYSIEIGPSYKTGIKDDEVCLRVCAVTLTLSVQATANELFGTGRTLADVLSFVESYLTDKEA